MQNKLTVPAIIAGIFTSIVALFNLINLFDLFEVIGKVSGDYALPIYLDLFVAITFVVALVMIAIGMFMSKHDMVKKSFITVAVAYIIEFVDIIILLAMEGSLKYAFEGSNAKAMLALISRYSLSAIACFIIAEIIKARQLNQTVKTKWFVPGLLFFIHILVQLIFIGNLLASNNLSLSDAANSTAYLLVISSLGMFFAVGLAYYYAENPTMFSGASAGTAGYNNNPYMNQAPKQPMYGQPQQPMYGQPQQPMYGQPQQPMYGQPQQPMYGQPQQPTYGQPQQPMYGQPQQPMYGQPQQPMYGQPQQPMYGQPQQPTYGQPQQPYNNQQ